MSSVGLMGHRGGTTPTRTLNAQAQRDGDPSFVTPAGPPAAPGPGIRRQRRHQGRQSALRLLRSDHPPRASSVAGGWPGWADASIPALPAGPRKARDARAHPPGPPRAGLRGVAHSPVVATAPPRAPRAGHHPAGLPRFRPPSAPARAQAATPPKPDPISLDTVSTTMTAAKEVDDEMAKAETDSWQ
jgi:hypothetical protein